MHFVLHPHALYVYCARSSDTHSQWRTHELLCILKNADPWSHRRASARTGKRQENAVHERTCIKIHSKYVSVGVAMAAAVAHGNAELETVCVGWVNTVFGDVALRTACDIWLEWAVWRDFLPTERIRDRYGNTHNNKKKHNSLSWSDFESGWSGSVALGLNLSACALCQCHRLYRCLLFSSVLCVAPALLM